MHNKNMMRALLWKRLLPKNNNLVIGLHESCLVLDQMDGVCRLEATCLGVSVSEESRVEREDA